MKCYIIGPGGAGKSTVGRCLAKLLQFDFIDLDDHYLKTYGNINADIERVGYDAYCQKNIRLFEQLDANNHTGVIVLSSGFTTYPKQSTESYLALKNRILNHRYCIRLLPGKTWHECKNFIVARQLKRGLGYQKEQEVKKIQTRYHLYLNIGTIRVNSQYASDKVVEDILAHMTEDYGNGNIKHEEF